jgi:outer membrane receptor protein involved in Fe transport
VLEEVLVTGTRLGIPLEESSAKVITLTERDMERSGADSLSKVLDSLPMNTGSPLNSNMDGAMGAAYADLRGLGEQRTLVLVNGRRFPNGGLGGDAAVDLNMLPVSLIERVEVLPTGASAVHGSDAIGGVINAVMRQEGGSASASRHATEHGGGGITQAQLGLAFPFATVDWGVAVDYVDQEGLTAAERDYSAQPLRIGDTDGTLVFAGQNGIPDGQFTVPEDNALGLEPGRYMRIPGSTGQTAGDYRPFTRDDAFNQSEYNYSQMPNERRSLWLFGSRPFDGGERLFLEALIHERESTSQGSPDQLLTFADNVPILESGAPGIPATNYYNPFGVDLEFAARRFVEQGPRRIEQDVEIWRVVAGIEGDIGNWSWEFAFGSAESDSVNRTTGAFASSRYPMALGPSGLDANGRIVCGDPDPVTGIVAAADIIEGCVPLDIFNGAGSITPEQLAYMSPRPIVDHGTNDQRIADAVFRGNWARVLGRDVRWVLGGEYRRESGSRVGDPLRDLEFLGLVETNLPRAEFEVGELFAEAQIPLFHDLTAIRDMALTAGVRWSDFSSFGQNTAWQLGLTWQPLEELRLRASFATVFRAPSILELSETRSLATSDAPDPCGNDPTPAQQVNCEADGVPGGAYVQEEGSEFASAIGGNPDLDPETGDSLGIGATYSPRWAPGLSISVDYFRIELSDIIGTPDVEGILFDCADTGNDQACDLVTRRPDGSPRLVVAVNANLSRHETSGFDVAIDWHHDSRFGEFGVGVLGTYLDIWQEQPFNQGITFDYAGRTDAGALPRVRAEGHVDWRSGPWHAGYSLTYIGSTTETVLPAPPLGIFFEPFDREVSAEMYHDVEGGYRFGNGLQLRLAIINLADRDPPFVNTGLPENTDPATYPLLGRSCFFSVRYDFGD